MAILKQKIIPHLWFDSQAKEAAEFYVNVFSKNKQKSKIISIANYPEATAGVSEKPAGSVMMVEFSLASQKFLALNGGPAFKLSEAFSLIINCKNQKEIDYFWDTLSEGGDEGSQMCGWLKDKFGLSWQIVPENWSKLAKNEKKFNLIMEKVLKMKKIIINDLK